MAVAVARSGAGDNSSGSSLPSSERGASGKQVRRRILVVDDDESSREGMTSLLSTWGHHVQAAEDGRQALALASTFRPAVILTDLVMPGLNGIDLLRALNQELPSAPVIIITGHATIETAVAAVRDGAYDYLTKPTDVRRLRVVLDKAIEKAEVVREVALLRRRLREDRGFGLLLGRSPAMQEVYRQIEVAAPTSAPVLISGETGTGKELVARTIHLHSPRGKQPFVAVNCSAIPDTLLESELFGHEKGAFTGAGDRRAGLFELADAGTIFLDEITEMSGMLQAKYLRTLQEGTLRRVGGNTEIQVDVRVIAATNQDPMRALREGKFREDLFYRLNVMNISLPALRQRREDIPLLVEACVREFSQRYDKAVSGVDEAGMHLLVQHGWPGNVRELRNVVERAVVACDGDQLTTRHLPLRATPEAEPSPDAVVLPLGSTIDHAERELVLRTLASTGNNRTRAAEILGISPKTLYNKLQRYTAESQRPA